MKKLFLFCLVVIAVACKQDFERVVKNEKVPDDIVSKLKQAGFVTEVGLSKYKIHDKEGYLVEYDMFFTEDEINAMGENEIESTGKKGTDNGSGARKNHYRTNNRVTGLPRTISVFMDPNFDNFMQNAFDISLARFNNENLGLTFTRSTDRFSANIRIVTFFEIGNRLGVSSGAPSGGNPASQISLNTFFFNGTNRADAVTTITHEIGHAIGFRHTDFMNRLFSCINDNQPNEGSGPDGANYIPGTPVGPSQASWMLACSDGTDRPFTNQDRLALCNLYGGFPTEELYAIRNNRLNGIDQNTAASRTVNCEDWTGSRLLSYTSGNIFSVIGDNFVRKDANGATSILGNGWTGAEVMSAMGGFVYTIQGGNFWRTDGSSGNTVSMGGGWSGAQAMTAMSGFIYTIQGGNFWKTNASNGATVSMGSGWSGAEAMASTGGFIYTVQGGNFWKTNASNGATVSLGSGWTGTTAMAAYGGNIYAIHQGNLYRVSSNGNAVLLASGWNNTPALTGAQ